MELSERTVLVAGGAGTVGGYVTAELLRQGATVLVPSRTADRLDALAERMVAEAPDAPGKLVPVTADVQVPEGVDAVRDTIAAGGGQLHGVVSALGGWWQGESLIEVDDAVWDRIWSGNLRSHVVVARHFVPSLVATAEATGVRTTYAALAGIAAVLPIPGSGPICVTGAAQRMLVRALAAELREAKSGVDVHEVSLNNPVVRDESERDERYPGEPVLWGSDVGRIVARLMLPAPASTAGTEDVVLDFGEIPEGTLL